MYSNIFADGALCHEYWLIAAHTLTILSCYLYIRKYSPKEAFWCVNVRSLLDDFQLILMITVSSLVYRIYMTRQGHEERAFILFHSENDLCSFLFIWVRIL